MTRYVLDYRRRGPVVVDWKRLIYVLVGTGYLHFLSIVGIGVFIQEPPWNETSPFQLWTMMLMVCLICAVMVFPAMYVLIWAYRLRWCPSNVLPPDEISRAEVRGGGPRLEEPPTEKWRVWRFWAHEKHERKDQVEGSTTRHYGCADWFFHCSAAVHGRANLPISDCLPIYGLRYLGFCDLHGWQLCCV